MCDQNLETKRNAFHSNAFLLKEFLYFILDKKLCIIEWAAFLLHGIILFSEALQILLHFNGLHSFYIYILSDPIIFVYSVVKISLYKVLQGL